MSEASGYQFMLTDDFETSVDYALICRDTPVYGSFIVTVVLGFPYEGRPILRTRAAAREWLEAKYGKAETRLVFNGNGQPTEVVKPGVLWCTTPTTSRQSTLYFRIATERSLLS